MKAKTSPKLESGSRVAVMGGGPAGSFFSYFLLDMAQRRGIALDVDIYEPRDFNVAGPAGCNMCGGIVSESLVQLLAAEGITLPKTVVERAIDSYTLHMQEGSVHIDTPMHERRIAAVHRGAGPRGMQRSEWASFDNHLLQLAKSKGASVYRTRVDGIARQNGRPRLTARGRSSEPYDLLVVATGVNSSAAKLFDGLGLEYRPPETSRAFVGELYGGQETISQCLGSSMHVFLLALPRLEFAALIPKGDYVTVCLLGRDIDNGLVRSFLDAPEVKRCLPPGWVMPQDFCHCSPRINIRAARTPFADRIVFIGDAGATRLYKDGMGAAYRTAKAAAVTALFHGISAQDLRRYYAPVCRRTELDNALGRVLFWMTQVQRAYPSSRRGILRMVAREQSQSHGPRRMSSVMWDMFTGSSSYGSIFVRTLHPLFLMGLLWQVIAGIVSSFRPAKLEASSPDLAALGRFSQESGTMSAASAPRSICGRPEEGEHVSAHS